MNDLAIFMLMFCRALGLITFLPLEILPQGYALKMLLTLMLTCLGFFRIEQAVSPDILDYPLQFMYGFAQALPVLLLLQVLEILGDLIEALRGQSMGSMLNPMSQIENSILPILLRSLLWVMMIQAGVIEKIFSAFLSNLNQTGFDLSFWKNNLDLLLKILPIAFSLALIFAFLVLTVEICLAFGSKLLPNFQLEHLGFFARSMICGLALLILLKTEFMFAFIKIYMLITYE